MANIIEVIIRASGAGQVKGEVSDADKALRGLTKAAGALGIALGARELIAFTADSMALARAQKDARNALTSTVGSAAAYQQAIDQARDATRGMASEAELATGINTLLNMHLAANSQEAARLSMAGNTLAKVYAANGASAEKYYRLLSGGSPILYDNFGLTAEMVTAKQQEIQANTDLSASEAKMQALRQLTIEVADRYNQSLSEETVAAGQTQAAAEDLKAAWGELTNSFIYGTGIAGKAAEAMRGLKAVIEGDSSAQQKHARDILEAADSYADYSRAMNQSGLQSQRLGKAQFEHVKAALAASDADVELGAEEMRLAAAANRLATAQGNLNDALDDTQEKALALRGSTVGLDSSAKVLAYAMGQVGQVGPGLAAQAESTVEEHNQAIRDSAEETGRVWQQSMESAADRMRSVIESAIQPTLAEVWQPPEAGMPRMDEAARRLATVATSGFGSEWLTQLNQQFAGMSFWQPIADAMQAGDEGALKEAATQILTGPGVSQLWDKELIKQRVREQLQAENMRAELVSTIQQELAAEGVTVGVGEVGAAMGGGAAIAGQLTGGMAAALPDAMAESGAGTAMINGITELVKADEKNMKLLATAFAEGFSTYLPAAMGMPADVFLASLVNEVAGRLGIATELRP